jgi:hypothetical protein
MAKKTAKNSTNQLPAGTLVRQSDGCTTSAETRAADRAARTCEAWNDNLTSRERRHRYHPSPQKVHPQVRGAGRDR